MEEARLIVSIYMTLWKRPNYKDRKDISSCSSTGVGGEVDLKVPRGMFLDDGNILCLDFGHGFTILCICQNSQKCVLQKSGFYHV